MSSHHDVLQFWFNESSPDQWFQKSIEFDNEIKNKFGKLHNQAIQCELQHWRSTPKGRLAEIIILDQFSRNIYRNDPKSFASDSLALGLAQECISLEAHKKLSIIERTFIYMPYMHSESLRIHEIAVQLFSELGMEKNYKFELLHKEIIEKFGRYPHRNQILNRVSTPLELEFLKQENSSF